MLAAPAVAAVATAAAVGAVTEATTASAPAALSVAASIFGPAPRPWVSGGAGGEQRASLSPRGERR